MNGPKRSDNIRLDWIDDIIKQSRSDDIKKSGEENTSLWKCQEGRQEMRRQGEAIF